MSESTSGDAPEFKKTVLSNGVTILTERHPLSRSVSCGVFVNSGTRDESASMNGAAHLIEHMVFKGTKRRTAFQIAKTLEAVGGELNAYTTREFTCYYTVSLKEHCRLSLDVLLDLVANADFPRRDYLKEREVVIQEIDMTKELFEDSIYDYYFESAYPDHPIGMSILGTHSTLAGISRNDLKRYYHRAYSPRNILVSIAGDIDHDRIVKWVEERIGRLKNQGRAHQRTPAKLRGFQAFVKRPSEQVHVLVGCPAPRFSGRLRLECLLVSALLGGGMTSRLYQKIRERRGLAYTVYSNMSSFTDSGLLMIYAAVAPENVGKTLEIIAQELKRLKREGIRRHDLRLFKTQIMGNILLGADDLDNRMNSIAINEMVFKKYRPVEDVIADIESITVASTEQCIDQYLKWSQTGLMMVGPIEKEEGQKWIEKFHFD